MTRLKQIRQVPCCSCFAPPPSDACHTCHQWLDQYQEMARDEVREWFLGKLAFVNVALQQNDETAF